jgi:predicted HTH domain antitoxin
LLFAGLHSIYAKSHESHRIAILVISISPPTQTIQIQFPDTVFSALRKAPDEFVQEMRVAAAVKWYELGEVSQGKAAEVAGLSRADFIEALSRYKVSVLQYTPEDLTQELVEAN